MHIFTLARSQWLWWNSLINQSGGRLFTRPATRARFCFLCFVCFLWVLSVESLKASSSSSLGSSPPSMSVFDCRAKSVAPNNSNGLKSDPQILLSLSRSCSSCLAIYISSVSANSTMAERYNDLKKILFGRLVLIKRLSIGDDDIVKDILRYRLDFRLSTRRGDFVKQKKIHDIKNTH